MDEEFPLVSKENDKSWRVEFSRSSALAHASKDIKSQSKSYVHNVTDDSGLLEDWQVSMHIIKASIGTGILGLPLSLNLAGIVVGPVILLLMGLLSLHCMHLLVTCSRLTTKRFNSQRLDYGQLTQKIFDIYIPKYSWILSLLVNILICVLQLGFCCVYIQFVADNCYQIFYESFNLKVWTTILLPFVIIPSMIKSLNVISYVSLASNILAVLGLLGVFQYLVFNIHDVSRYPAWGGFPKFFVFFGQAVFAFQGIGVILPVEIKAKNPTHFVTVMSISMAVVIILYLSLAILGFMAFGRHTMGSITLNLPETPIYQAVRTAYALAIYLTFFIQFYVPMSIITPVIKQRWSKRKATFLEYFARVMFVLLTYGASMSSSEIGDSIALVGSMAGSAVLFIIPSLLHIFCIWDRKSELYIVFLICKDFVIILIGVIGAIAGTYESVVSMIEDNTKA